MKSRPIQYHKVTLSESKDATRCMYVHPLSLAKRVKSENLEDILRLISAGFATNANYYVDRIILSKEACTVRFIDLNRKPLQYQTKLFFLSNLKDNSKATIALCDLPPDVQGMVKSAAIQSDYAGAAAARRRKDEIIDTAEKEAKLKEEARTKAEQAALLQEAAEAAAVKAKRDAEAKVKADIVAGKEFFEFDPAKDTVESAAKGYNEAKFAEKFKGSQAKKLEITATYDDLIVAKEEKTLFLKRIKEENTKKLAELNQKEKAIQNKLNDHPTRIASAKLAAESAFQTAYNGYDQSIASQQIRILLSALDNYKKTHNWNQEAVDTLAVALKIDPKIIRFDHARTNFYNVLQKKTRAEIAELFVRMYQSLNNKVGEKEKNKKHPFISLFKAAFVEEQEKLSEDAVKEQMKAELFSLRTAAERQITDMHEEIAQDLIAYEQSITDYEQFLKKETDDFIAIQKLLTTAEEKDASGESISEFSRLKKSIEEMQEKARVLQAEITKKEQEYKLPASGQDEMGKFAELTQTAITTIQQEEYSFIKAQKQLLDALKNTNISFKEATKVESGAKEKQADSFRKSQQQVQTAQSALQAIQSRHDRIMAKAAEEAERIKIQQELYNNLEALLIEQVDYWKKQQSIVGGTDVLGNNGKKTNVPTGIGEMIRVIDEQRKPVADNKNKSTSRFSHFFKNNAKPILPLSLKERKEVAPDVIMQRLKDLSAIANKRLTARNFLGLKKDAGRTAATTDFYKKLAAVSDADLTDIKKLKKHIKEFNGSIAKKTQEKIAKKLKK